MIYVNLSTMNIGKELNSIRERLGISQIDLSDKSGIPIATLQRLLWGRTATMENIILVADAMGYEIVLQMKAAK
jgi:predicted transcriptional regulator